MKKSKFTKFIAVFLASVTICSSFSALAADIPDNATDPAKETDKDSGTLDRNIEEVKEILNAISYEDYLKRNADIPDATSSFKINAVDYDKDATTAKVEVKKDFEGKGSSLLLPDDGKVGWKIDVPATGKYAIKMEYFPVSGKATSIERMFLIDGKVPFKEARYLTATKIWIDEFEADGNFKSDINGNDIRPQKSEKPKWRTYSFNDSLGSYLEPFKFAFTKGEHLIQLDAVREPIIINSIELYPLEALKTYAEVKAEYAAKGYKPASVNSVIKVDAEKPSAASDRVIYPIYDRTSPITDPQDPAIIKLNTIGRDKWQTVGQWIQWEVDVPESGLYQIAPRYKQATLAGMYVSRRITINGEIPFEEANRLRFNYSDQWQVKPINNNAEEFEFYLEAGKNVIELEVALGDMSDILRRVENSLSNMNKAYLKILMITGPTPDPYRDYNFGRLIPNEISSLYVEEKNLTQVSKELTELVGIKGDHVATLDKIALLLGRMGSDEDEIAKNLENLKTNIGSLGTWLLTSKNQPLELDYLMIQPKGVALPPANANFFQAAWHEIRSFVMSFFTDYNSLGASEKIDKDEIVEVWLATGRDQAQIIRQLVDNDFTPKKNISVNVKLVAGGTLLPATLSGTGPDINLFSTGNEAINYAIRSAVLPLNEFPSFNEVTKRFHPSAMVPVTLYGKTYGIPETQTFSMMFYRKDIFADLGIEIPKTWDDLHAIVPVLQNNKMEVGFPSSLAGSNLFLYQMGGDLYADDGKRINLDSNLALDAFRDMCELFEMYRFPRTYDFPNRFRTGEMPLGIAEYSGTYNQLTIFATEIRGLWEFVPLPGIMDKDGNINNVSTAGVNCSVMMRNAKNPEKAWEFMDWYTSADTQSNYANELVATMGPAAKHPTANREALVELPWPTRDYENLASQFDNLAGIPEMPGGYIIQRYVDFAFLAVYNDGADPVESMLDKIPEINKEITRKRKEFGLEVIEVPSDVK